MVRIQHNGQMVHGLDGNFVLKVNKSWRKFKDSQILAPSFEDGINWMIVHYTCQVALSYFSFIYSNEKAFTARGGPDSKFGYLENNFKMIACVGNDVNFVVVTIRLSKVTNQVFQSPPILGRF